MTEEELNNIFDILGPLYRNLACPVCNAKSWNLDPAFAALPTIVNPIGRQFTLVVQNTCTACGHIMLHDPRAMGVDVSRLGEPSDTI